MHIYLAQSQIGGCVAMQFSDVCMLYLVYACSHVDADKLHLVVGPNYFVCIHYSILPSTLWFKTLSVYHSAQFPFGDKKATTK